MAPQMATGVPPPAAPSRKAPKAKPIRMAWMRASPDSPAVQRRRLQQRRSLGDVWVLGIRPVRRRRFRLRRFRLRLIHLGGRPVEVPFLARLPEA